MENCISISRNAELHPQPLGLHTTCRQGDEHLHQNAAAHRDQAIGTQPHRKAGQRFSAHRQDGCKQQVVKLKRKIMPVVVMEHQMYDSKHQPAWLVYSQVELRFGKF